MKIAVDEKLPAIAAQVKDSNEACAKQLETPSEKKCVRVGN